MRFLLKPALAGAFLCALVSASLLAAPAKEPQPPDEKAIAAVRARAEELGQAIAKLRARVTEENRRAEADRSKSRYELIHAAKARDDRLADVEVFHKAGVYQLKHAQWYAPDDAKRTLAVLDRGLARATELASGEASWLTRRGEAIRAYRSEIDGSVQPYAVVLPEGYPGATDKFWRLDVILHGRDDQLTETKFIAAHDSDKPAPKQDFVELHVFGRTCNAYRWAGERDVFEALESLRYTEHRLSGPMPAHHKLDESRTVLRGFSMGGAGAWHLGLHFPSEWCSVSPGAGFTTTYGPVKNKDGKLPWYEEKCLSIYEAIDYAENVRAVPFVAYGGEDDPQLEAAKSIEGKLKPLGISLTLLIGPKTQHKYHPDSLKEIMRLQGEHAEKGCLEFPATVHFVTWYPNYHKCAWVDIVNQEELYARASVNATYKQNEFQIETENVHALRLSLPEDRGEHPTRLVTIDRQTVRAPMVGIVADYHDSIILVKNEQKLWTASNRYGEFYPPDAKSRKHRQLCGPIDDAFTRKFLCVRGTGMPWNESTQKYADAALSRFEYEWSRYFRGDLPIKNDRDLTDDDRKWTNLILFGDGGSNSEIAARLKQGLGELKWTKDAIEFGGKSFPSAENVPVMIFPYKENYIVLNSGHTFHEADFKASNRMLYPRLGDYAILKPEPTKEDPCAAAVVTAGLFDENWKLPKQP